MILYGDALTKALLIWAAALFTIGMILAGFGVWTLWIKPGDEDEQPAYLELSEVEILDRLDAELDHRAIRAIDDAYGHRRWTR